MALEGMRRVRWRLHLSLAAITTAEGSTVQIALVKALQPLGE
jgi:hypothetical protein